MCGIFAYVGRKTTIRIAIEGLRKVEYRGYDSAGLAYIDEGKLMTKKAIGKLGSLEKLVGEESSPCIIAHTRWATHGKVTESNAHPILDQSNSIAVVHNGIVENFEQLRHELEREGIVFRTETDTEVIANLLSKFYTNDLLRAVQEVMPLLTGSSAFVAIHKDHPDECVAAKIGSPIVVGVGEGETFLASDPNAIIHHTRDVIYLADGEVVRIKPHSVELFDSSRAPVSKRVEQLKHSAEEFSKGDFEHFTLKEIHDQPQAIRNAMLSRFLEDYGTAIFEELHMKPAELLAVKRIVIVAAGTSFHAGLIAGYMLEEIARIPTDVEISSEFRYRNPIVAEGTLVLAISQSGETADTIAAVRELKAKGATVIGICNVQGSTLSRDADGTLFLHAGPEIGVCSTKAFTTQLTVLSLFTLMMARLRHISKAEGQEFLSALKAIPSQVEQILSNSGAIERLADTYSQYNDFFFIGRRYMFPTCLEGALKLKEIAYINANGYAAGEMKHGPIALLNERCPTLALCTDMVTYDKVVSNVMEARARHSPILAITFEGDTRLKKIADDIIEIPKTRDDLAPITTAVVCQLFAYFCAKKRGADIDQPKNLAKSVTVE